VGWGFARKRASGAGRSWIKRGSEPIPKSAWTVAKRAAMRKLYLDAGAGLPEVIEYGERGCGVAGVARSRRV